MTSLRRSIARSDPASDFLGRCKQDSSRQMCGHRRRHEARLDGDHVHALPVYAVAHALQKRRERRLRRAINVICLPPAIARYRRNRRDRPALPRRKIIRQPRDQRHRAQQIRADHLFRHPVILFRGRLIPQHSVRDQRDVDPLQLFMRILQKRSVVLRVVSRSITQV